MDSTDPAQAPAYQNGGLHRAGSMSSQQSQTAQDFIKQQLQMEADAREALPYQFDTCTKPLGPLRQAIFACLTCSPPPASVHQQFTPAGVCYSCSISCHGEHTLVEIFTKRDFVCDCGTTRLTNSGTPCSLRLNPETGRKGDVKGEEARADNKYNQNFKGTFCGCGDEYDPETEKGTMFQCLGLGHLADDGCGEDWWHPECLMGLPRVKPEPRPQTTTASGLETVKEEAENKEGAETTEQAPTTTVAEDPSDEPPLPQGFPQEDDFHHLFCYKCVSAFPWIKQYAGTPGFLAAVPADGRKPQPDVTNPTAAEHETGKKRKAGDDLEENPDAKKVKSDEETEVQASSPSHQDAGSAPKHLSLPTLPDGQFSLFVKEDFRDHFCRCKDCFPRLAKHPQLLEEEDTYEPPVSESDGPNENGSVAGRSVHSGSLLDRGEAALSSMDRVRAIEGVMAYNHVRDKVKAFLRPFADSGQAVGAEDIKAYFAKLRGDEQAMKDAAVGASSSGEVDNRKEQDGY